MPPVDNKVAAAALRPEQLGLIKAWIDQGRKAPSAPSPELLPRSAASLGAHPILALAITPDDEYVGCSRGDELAIYDLRGPRMVAELVDPALAASGRPGAAHEDLIRSLAFDHQGDLLASGGFRTVKLWRARTARSNEKSPASQAARAIAVSPNGLLIAVGTQTGAIELHDPSGKQPRQDLRRQTRCAPSPAWHSRPMVRGCIPPGWIKRSAFGMSPAAMQLGKQTTPAEVRALVRASRRDQIAKIATGEADNVVRIWNMADDSQTARRRRAAPPARELKGHTSRSPALAILPGGKTRAAALGQRRLACAHLEFSHRRIDRAISTHGGPVTAVAASPDGKPISVGQQQRRGPALESRRRRH